jgi:hypothetical protein
MKALFMLAPQATWRSGTSSLSTVSARPAGVGQAAALNEVEVGLGGVLLLGAGQV